MLAKSTVAALSTCSENASFRYISTVDAHYIYFSELQMTVTISVRLFSYLL